MSKEINARVLLKYDTAANWAQATFIPKKGEMIIYAPEGNTPIRYKIGDGTTAIGALPFVATAGEDGVNGLSIYRSTATSGTSTTSIALNTVTVPAGRSIQVGDLIIANTTYSYLYRVTAISGTTLTVTYLQSLRGATGIKGDKGDTGTSITSVEQTTTSTADDGNNVVTVTLSDGTSSTFTVQNGSKGSKGDKGDTGTTPTIKAANGTNVASVGTPSVTASTSGTTTTFTFNYLKGAKGDKGDKGDTGDDGIASVTTTGTGNVITDLSYDETTQVLTATKGATYSNTHTITATATDDDVIVLTGTNGSNQVTYDAKHAKKGPSTTASTTKGATADTTVTAGAGTKTIKVPKVTVDAYGHTTGLTEQTLSITIPATPTALKNPNALTVGSKTYDGSSAVSITADDLGLSAAMKFIGTSDISIEDGDVTNPITIGGVSTTVSNGNVAIYGAKEFIWNGSKWEEFGNEGNYKVVQSAVASPSASGTTTAFIDTISQNAQGVITATKKTVASATQSAAGLMSAADKKKLDGIASGATANTGDITAVTAGAGLTGGATSGAATLAVGAGAGIVVNDDNVALATSGVTAGTYGPSENVTGSNNATMNVPEITVDEYGRVTAVTNRVYTAKNTADTDKKTASSNTSSKIFLVGATTQSSSGQTTYSHDTVYVGTDGHLYDTDKLVATQTYVDSAIASAITTVLNTAV